MLLPAVVLALSVAACTGDSGGTTVTTAPASTTAVESPTSLAGTSSTTTTGAPPETSAATTLPARVGESVDPAVASAVEAEIAELVAATEEVRGLEFLEPPDLAVVSLDELAALIREDAAEELADIGPDERLLRLLGLIEPDTDLRALIEELLAEQVLGFYDGETRELVVRGDQESLSPLTRLIVVHELVHALTDQHFGFFERLEALVDEDRFDEAAALQALIEGDATYFQLVYMQESLGLTELVSLQQEITSQDFSVLESSPQFLQDDLAFPYDEGFRYVTALVDAGGIAAVDDAYEAPPLTTEQILHPERYLAGEPPLDVDLPPTPVDGYEVYEESVLGEWGVSLLFVGNDDRGLVTQVGAGWGGDRYRVLDNGTDVALVLRYRGETDQDAVEVTQAWLRLLTERFGEGAADAEGELFQSDAGYGFVDREGDSLTVIVASDPAVGAALREAVAAG